MSDKTLIPWADATWPVVAGCTRVSEGCRNCYAVRDSWRLGHNPHLAIRAAYRDTVEKGATSGKLDWSGTVRTLPERLDWPLKWRKPRRIFVSNMADLFHPRVPLSFVHDVWRTAFNVRRHTYLYLTKRPEILLLFTRATARAKYCPESEIWPTWMQLGVSVEDETTAWQRIPPLLSVPVSSRNVLYVSAEPLLGPLDLSRWLSGTPRLSWVVAGGESGPKARPTHPDWARSLRDQCQASGTPFFFKQWGEWAPATAEYGAAGSLMPETGERYTWIGWDGATQNPSWHGLQDPVMAIARVGRQAAGCLLDGREWREFPEEVRP